VPSSGNNIKAGHLCQIWSTRGGEDSSHGVLGCDAV